MYIRVCAKHFLLMTGEFSPNHLYKLLSFVTEGGIVIYNLKLIYVAPAFELSGIKPMLYALSQASLRIFLRLKGSPPPNVGTSIMFVLHTKDSTHMTLFTFKPKERRGVRRTSTSPVIHGLRQSLRWKAHRSE